VLNSFSGFAGGTYSFTFSLPAGEYETDFFADVQDAGGCFASSPAQGGALVISAGPPTGQPTPAPVCFNGVDNVIDLTDYDAEAGGGAQVQWFVDEQGTVPVNGPRSVELERGITTIYGSVTVDGCTTIQPVDFEVFDAEVLIVECELEDFATEGGTDGSILVNIFGGTSPYSLTYSGTATGSISSPQAPSELVNGLAEGTYIFTLTDANGCSTVCSSTVTTEAANPCIPANDAQALLELYNNTDGPNWRNVNDPAWADGANWLTPNLPLAQWDGITVNAEGCVSILDLDGRDDGMNSTSPGGLMMDGPLAGSIGQLRHLDSLYLTDNFNLNSTIPDEFYGLNNLQLAFLDNIGFDQPISPDFINMTSLNTFVADYNRFDIEDLLPAVDAFSVIRARGGVVIFSPQDSIYAGSYHEIDEGQPLTVDLGEQPNAENVYRWYRNDVLEQEITGGSGLLTFSTIELADAGTYYARVSHPDLSDFELLSRAVVIEVNASLPTCSDGIMNGEETGVDCGGPDCPECACPHPDYAPLMALYDSTNGSEWVGGTTIDGWADGAAGLNCDPCTWSRVVCNGSGRVTGLSLFNVNMSGRIPELISGLDSLERLFLLGNNLTDTLPMSMSTLTKLRNLTLSQNLLTGEIPEWIGSLQNLETLALDRNGFFGELPSTIYSLAELEILRLGNNSLMGEISNDINSLSSLRDINLFSNSFSGSIPFSIGECNELESISMSENNLSGTIPQSIGELPNLTSLFLGDNQLTGSVPFSIWSNPRLERLSLNANTLDGEISGSIANNGALISLFLNDNNFEGCLDPALDRFCPPFLADISNERLPWGGNLDSLCFYSFSSLEQIGAPCNDGNPNTENDTIDVDCNCIGEPVCNHPDYEPLMALYNSTNGNNWTFNGTNAKNCARSPNSPTSRSSTWSSRGSCLTAWGLGPKFSGQRSGIPTLPGRFPRVLVTGLNALTLTSMQMNLQEKSLLRLVTWGHSLPSSWLVII